MESLGFIETYGLTCAIEAADAALKAANVTLVGHKKTKSGDITIIIKGDVGAVKAAVDAGTAAAEKIGIVRSSHVIPRLDDLAEDVLFGEFTPKKAKAVEKTPPVEVVTTEEKSTKEKPVVKSITIKEKSVDSSKSTPKKK